MHASSLYLIKVSVYVLAFYIPFVLILRRTTFFNINRAYLIAGLLLSFALPFYTGFSVISSYTPSEHSFMEPILTQTELVISQATDSTGSISVSVLISILYAIGIGVRFVALAFSIANILKTKSHAEISTYQNTKVFRTHTSVPFSFFNCVFLPKALDKPGILEHEAAHARQYHWLDLLIVELVSIILWFNPIMFAYTRSLKEQHEYLADQTAIKSGIGVGEYLESIKQQIELSVLSPLTSEFYFQSIKNRVYMLTRKRTSLSGLAAYTLVLPIIIILMMAFSAKKPFQIKQQGGMDSFQENISLSLPLDKNNISLMGDGYGDRLHPVLGVRRLHTGIDFFAEEGIPVVSTEGGVVIEAHMAGAWGNIIVVQHDDTYSTSYSHLKSMNVKKGNKVQKGQQIGTVGNTGMSTKNHLHFELHKNGAAIDPIKHLPTLR